MGQIDFIFDLDTSETDKYFVRQINYEDTKDLILNVHYAKRMPSISYAYGLFEDGNLATGFLHYDYKALEYVLQYYIIITLPSIYRWDPFTVFTKILISYLCSCLISDLFKMDIQGVPKRSGNEIKPS